MPRVLLSTLGYTPQKVTPAIRHESPLSRLVVFYGPVENKRTTAAFEEVRGACGALSLPLVARPLRNPHDFEACVRTFRREVRSLDERPSDVVFNTSGGTGVMQMAAAFVCFTEGIRMSYYNRETGSYVPMGPIRLVDSERLREPKRRIVEHLARQATGVEPARLSRAFRLGASNLHKHLDDLERQGWVERVRPPDVRRDRVAATPAARLLFG
ncbi:MAG: MarR family transcriptional regulator [Methanobacteriota archaeon]